jgi:hypothetical protein
VHLGCAHLQKGKLFDEVDEGHGRKIGGCSKRTEMTAELRHNAPQHNLHASQAGNAGDCTSSAHSSLPWRRLGRFFVTTVLASFVLNEVWEMAQMSAYVETAGQSWTSTLGLCTRAAVGDVGIIWAFTRRLRWPLAIWAGACAAVGTFMPRRLFWGWLMRRWWNMRRWPPGAGRTRSACLWCPCLARACGRYSK